MRELPHRIFHVVEAQNWTAVQRDGLLSAHALAARARRLGHPTDDDGAYRPRGLALGDGSYLRDQAPMPPAALARCLDPGLSPEAWYALVNTGIYFWASEERMRRHLRALRGRAQLLLALDGPRLAAAYRDAAYVTAFNVGAAVRKPARRGHRSFVPYDRWRIAAWADEAEPGGRPRSPSHPPAELVVRRPIPDLLAYVVGTEPVAAEPPGH